MVSGDPFRSFGSKAAQYCRAVLGSDSLYLPLSNHGTSARAWIRTLMILDAILPTTSKGFWWQFSEEALHWC